MKSLLLLVLLSLYTQMRLCVGSSADWISAQHTCLRLPLLGTEDLCQQNAARDTLPTLTSELQQG